MSLQTQMAADLAEIHADTTDGASELCTYNPDGAAAIADIRITITRTGLAQERRADGLYEVERALAFVLVADVGTITLKDTITDAAGQSWAVVSIGTNNAAVWELTVSHPIRKAFIGANDQVRHAE